MFPRQKNTKSPNPQNTNKIIREEQDAEDILYNIGNEAASQLSELSNPASNESGNQSMGEKDPEDPIFPIIGNMNNDSGKNRIEKTNRFVNETKKASDDQRLYYMKVMFPASG